jgi:hypothetical protein
MQPMKHHQDSPDSLLITGTCDGSLDSIRKIKTFSELRRLLSDSVTEDAYCRSAIYFAFTGRGTVWTVKCDGSHLILLPHPNVPNTLLVFFPFASTALEFMKQIVGLCNFSSFLTRYSEVLLARVPETIANEVLAHMDCARAKLQHVDERKLDWVYPSYDLSVQSLLNPQGPEFSSYRNKINKFRKQGIEVVTAKKIPPDRLRTAVKQINESWIRTKQKNVTSLRDQDINELMDPYRTLARLSADATSGIDGIFLKREDVYIAFSFWERPGNSHTVPSFAAMTSSYEPGLSEYLHRCIAERLAVRYRHMCVGGSETAGLDHFKRKFSPVKTHRLRTIKLLLERP